MVQEIMGKTSKVGVLTPFYRGGEGRAREGRGGEGRGGEGRGGEEKKVSR